MKTLLTFLVALCVLCPSLGHSAVTTATSYNSSVRMTADGDVTCEPQASRTAGTIIVTRTTAGKVYKLVDPTSSSQGLLFAYTSSATGASFESSIHDLYIPANKGLEYDTDDTTTGTGHSITIYFKDSN
jgi:hypothetical protein